MSKDGQTILYREFTYDYEYIFYCIEDDDFDIGYADPTTDLYSEQWIEQFNMGDSNSVIEGELEGKTYHLIGVL